MKIFSEWHDRERKVNEYFAIDEADEEQPFILGGYSADENLPAIAQWGSASCFGLDNIDDIDGTAWADWRESLERIGCEWVVPIIEESLESGDVQMAVAAILKSKRGTQD